MAAYKETAEEQLLKMIEGPEGAKPPSTVEPAPVPRFRPFREMFQEGKARLLRILLPGWGQSHGDPLLWNLRLASRILWVFLAGLGAYVIFALVLVQPRYRSHPGLPAGTASSGSVSARNPLRPLGDYLGALLQRDPFTGRNLSPGQESSSQGAHRHVEELTNGLKLVGIDRGPQPAALIENAGQKRTFIVNVGDEINGMKVKKITSEGVVLSYEGEEVVLQ